MKKISITVVVLIVVAGVGWLFGKDMFQSDEEPDYTLVPVELGSVVEKALAVGTIEPRQEITVKSVVPGIIARVSADVGDIVNPGDPLLEISPNPTPYEFAETRMAVEVADVDYKNTVRNHERQMALYRQDFIPEETVETSRYAMDQATLRLNLAKEKMELLQKGRLATAEQQVENIIRARVKGTVLQRMVDVGDPVVPLTSYQEGTELMTIADMDQLIFKGTVDEIDVGKLKEGMPAILSIGALPGVELQGIKIVRVRGEQFIDQLLRVRGVGRALVERRPQRLWGHADRCVRRPRGRSHIYVKLHGASTSKTGGGPHGSGVRALSFRLVVRLRRRFVGSHDSSNNGGDRLGAAKQQRDLRRQ